MPMGAVPIADDRRETERKRRPREESKDASRYRSGDRVTPASSTNQEKADLKRMMGMYRAQKSKPRYITEVALPQPSRPGRAPSPAPYPCSLAVMYWSVYDCRRDKELD
jgi:hypothetical protein